jgi:hypothetical protein
VAVDCSSCRTSVLAVRRNAKARTPTVISDGHCHDACLLHPGLQIPACSKTTPEGREGHTNPVRDSDNARTQYSTLRSPTATGHRCRTCPQPEGGSRPAHGNKNWRTTTPRKSSLAFSPLRIHFRRNSDDDYCALFRAGPEYRTGLKNHLGGELWEGDDGPVCIHGLELVLVSWSSTSHKVSKHEG